MSRNAVVQALQDTHRAMSDLSYNIRDRTSGKGFVAGMNPMFDAMRQAAADAGLARLSIVAGKGQGHLSHARGTEADIVGYNADGSPWTKSQRVAVAKGAATAGGNRFGFYSGPTLHVGLGYPGAPKNVVWNNKLRGVPGVNTFAPEEQAFVNALRAGQLSRYVTTGAAPAGNPQVAALQQALKAHDPSIVVDGIMGPQTRAAMARYPAAAAAYTPTPAVTPAQQAVNAQARGAPIGGGISRSGPQIAALQQSLNSMGAKLKVDGLEGPLTRAATQQFFGSPTSVRTPGFTTATRPTVQASAPPQIPKTPYFMNPYTMTTGGANALTARIPQARPPQTPQARPEQVPQAVNPNIRQVPTAKVTSSPFPGLQFPSYSNNVTYPSAVQAGARAVPTVAVSAPGGPPRGGVWGAFQNPYVNSTGGANAIQAPRIPQPRPDYPPAQQAVRAVAEATLYQQMQEKMRRAAEVAAQVGSQFRDAYSQGMRSGMGYSGSTYSCGTYGGAGGSSISQGVGGAFRNR